MAAILSVGDVAFMTTIGQEFAAASQRIAPVDTGALRDSIDVESVAVRQVTVKAGGEAGSGHDRVAYAPAVEYGSGLYGRRGSTFPINAVNGPNLIFWWKKKGKLFVGPHVDHPGSRAQPFFRPILETMDFASRMKAEIVARWNAAA